MFAQIQQFLAPVRFRMQLRTAIRLAGVGTLVGGIVLVLFEVLRLWFDSEISPMVMASVFVAGPIAGFIAGWLRDCPWSSVATTIDRHYDLKDRTRTALEFSDAETPTAIQQLQLQDARERLRNIDARAVVSVGTPPRWQYIPFVLFCGLRMWMSPTIGSDPGEPVPTPQQAAAVVAEIQTEIDELETLAEETAVDELKELVAKLNQDLKQLKVPTMSVRDSMKTVSEMQQKMQAMMKDMDVAGMDAQLRKVGEAIAGAKPFKPAADAIADDDLTKAAEALENLTEEELSPDKMKAAESRPTAEKLAEAAEAAKEKGLDELSEQLSNLSEAVKSGEAKEAQEKAQNLAQTMKRQSVKKKLNNILKNKNNQLSHSKMQLAVQSQSEGDGSMAGKGQNLKIGKTDKSENDVASQKAGAKSAGNINGPKTQLQSERQMARLTGQLGDEGESDTETETVTTPESQARAQRQAQEAFNRYQKMSDAVLDSEAIPPGHRATIRKYFELIRPSRDTVLSE